MRLGSVTVMVATDQDGLGIASRTFRAVMGDEGVTPWSVLEEIDRTLAQSGMLIVGNDAGELPEMLAARKAEQFAAMETDSNRALHDSLEVARLVYARIDQSRAPNAPIAAMNRRTREELAGYRETSLREYEPGEYNFLPPFPFHRR